MMWDDILSIADIGFLRWPRRFAIFVLLGFGIYQSLHVEDFIQPCRSVADQIKDNKTLSIFMIVVGIIFVAYEIYDLVDYLRDRYWDWYYDKGPGSK
jgi:hypothetical protein